jgi:hypothetical protein
MSVFKRSAILWLVIIILSLIVFEIAALMHPEAWEMGYSRTPEKGWNIFFFVIGFNLLLIAFITGGNLFVRFGSITPGLIILFLQAIHIGWIAGTNSFMEPFPSIRSAHLAFLRIGMWEITAYVLFCSATLDKSLLISESFPAREWNETRKLSDLEFKTRDKIVLLLGTSAFLIAAIVEAFVG